MFGVMVDRICISRLYSVHPMLALHAALSPTPKYPLTPSFPNPPVLLFPLDPPVMATTTATGSNTNKDAETPNDAKHEHLLTPQTLLSLLSTAIYLGLNSLIKECVGLILGSVGPWSVGAYLGFALGDGAGLDRQGDEDGQASGSTSGGMDEGIRGLEGLAKKLPVDRKENVSARSTGKKDAEYTSESSSSKRSGDLEVKQEPLEDESDHPRKCSVKPSSERLARTVDSNLSIRPPSPGSVRSYEGERYTPKFFYGPVGDKIGEACMAWLARWAVDLIEVEEGVAEQEARKRQGTTGEEKRTRVTFDRALETRSGSPGTVDSTGKGKGLSSSLPEDGQRRRPRSISWQPDFPSSRPSQPHLPAAARPGTHNKFISLSGAVEGFPGSRTDLPRGKTVVLPPLKIWGHGGLPAEIVRGIISCDALFIANEVERYNLAKRVIALRQAGRQRARETRSLKRQGSGEGLFFGTKAEQGDLGMGKMHLGVKEEEMIGDDSFEEEEEIWQEEEDEEDAELNEIFRTGIYFSHMVSARSVTSAGKDLVGLRCAMCLVL